MQTKTTLPENNKVKMIIAQNIGRLMSEQEISRKLLCQNLSIKYTTLCDWLSGKSTPKAETMVILADYFNVNVGDLFIELPPDPEEHARDTQARLIKYTEKLRRLPMNIIDSLSDDQIKELLQSGFLFKHRSLEDYVEESGKPLIANSDVKWDKPKGDEIW